MSERAGFPARHRLPATPAEPPSAGPDTIAPAGPGHRAKVGQHSL